MLSAVLTAPSGGNPVRGGLFIAPAQPPPPSFCFSAARVWPRLSNCPPTAPLKNKKKGGGSRSAYRQVTPNGVFGPWRAPAVVGKHEIQAVCINQLLSTISPENVGKDKGDQGTVQAAARTLTSPSSHLWISLRPRIIESKMAAILNRGIRGIRGNPRR
jgi:hypothetical protein